MEAKFVVVLVVCAHLAGASLPIPSYIKPCCVDHPNYKECCRKMGQQALKSHKYREGDPKYGIKSVEPLQIDFMTSRGAGVQLNLTDVKIYGILNLDLHRAEAFRKPGHKRLEGDWVMHNVTMKGKYSVDGSVMVLAIQGRGDALVNLEKVDTRVVVHLKDKMIDGKNHVVLAGTSGTVKPSKVHIDLRNLFNGNKFLGDQMNTFMNENWKELLPIFDPLFNTVIAEATKAVLDGFSQYVAEEDIFPTKDCETV